MRQLSIVSILCFTVFCVVAVAYAENASIAIKAEALEPMELKVEPGTTVAWLNRDSRDVRVRFISEAVSTTCQAPKGFVLDRKGVYVSRAIPGGQIASLCFLESRDYKYVIEAYDSEGSEKWIPINLEGTVKVN